MQDSAASLLMLRADVSSDTSRAKSKLFDLLSDLDPLKASRLPALKLSREFLVSSVARSGPIRSSVYRGVRTQSERQRDYFDRVSRSNPKPSKLPSEEAPHSAYRAPGWFSVKEAEIPRVRLDASQMRALRRTSYASGKCHHCGARAVRRSFSPVAAGWTFWCYECGVMDKHCKPDREYEIGLAPRLGSKQEPTAKGEESEMRGDWGSKPFHLLTPNERTWRRIEENIALEARIEERARRKLG